MVCDGTLFAFGAMKLFLQPHFECSDMVILMVGSVPCGVYLLVGTTDPCYALTILYAHDCFFQRANCLGSLE